MLNLLDDQLAISFNIFLLVSILLGDLYSLMGESG